MLSKSGEPLVLRVNGKAQIVVQDAEAYQKLIAAAPRNDHEETMAAIREGMADVAAGRTKPAREVIRALAKKYRPAELDE
jgi:predicted transcriptional regulator